MYIYKRYVNKLIYFSLMFYRYRNTYGWVSLILSHMHHHDMEIHLDKTYENIEKSIKNQTQIADSGILLGSEVYREELLQFINMINEKRYKNKKIKISNELSSIPPDLSTVSQDNGRAKHRCPVVCPVNLNNFPFLTNTSEKSKRSSMVTRLCSPSLVSFYDACLLSSNPAVLTGKLSLFVQYYYDYHHYLHYCWEEIMFT